MVKKKEMRNLRNELYAYVFNIDTCLENYIIQTVGKQ